MKRVPRISLLWVAAMAAGFAGSAGAADTASVTFQPASGSQVNGQVTFTQVGNRVRAVGEVRGLAPGAHGFHLHEKGDCSAPDAESAGGHFNPAGAQHGGPGTSERHAGDFGNVTADAAGTAKIDLSVSGISVTRDQPNGIIGRGLVVHAQADDEKTNPSGNSGARVACGVVR